VAGLSAGSTYHFRLVFTVAKATTGDGSDATLTTEAATLAATTKPATGVTTT
jgi:hypothetical protein